MNTNTHYTGDIMFTVERQQEILNLLKSKKSISVTELSRMFFIGEATIRRDLEKLGKKGLLKRTYGGAVLLEGLDIEIPLSVRESEEKVPKDIIGNSAASLVTSGDIIIIDSSSTALRLVPYLSAKNNLTALTNGAKTAIELGELPQIKVYCTGGRLRENSLSFIGETAEIFIENYFADIVFFSCRSISTQYGIFDSNEQESSLRRIMMRNSKKSVLLCDHTKFDKVSFSKICDFTKIDCLITDVKPSDEWTNYLKDLDVKLIYP